MAIDLTVVEPTAPPAGGGRVLTIGPLESLERLANVDTEFVDAASRSEESIGSLPLVMVAAADRPWGLPRGFVQWLLLGTPDSVYAERSPEGTHYEATFTPNNRYEALFTDPACRTIAALWWLETVISEPADPLRFASRAYDNPWSNNVPAIAVTGPRFAPIDEPDTPRGSLAGSSCGGSRDGPARLPGRHRWIEVITGCMFSGKTEELIRRLNRARYATQRVVVFKPSVDTRYAASDVVSHSDDRIPCVPVEHATDIPRLAGDAQVVGIDEAQFFEGGLVEVANRLADEGRRVVIAGLDQDFLGNAFEPMPALMAISEYVTKTLAVCMVCGAPANRSQRLVARDARVVLGASEIYEARCRLHWDPTSFDSQQQQLPLDAD